MDLRHQRAGSVEHVKTARLRVGFDRLGYTVRAENSDGAVRHFVKFLDETRALATQVVDNMPVVNDLMAHVHRRAMSFKSAIDNLDRADHARTKAAGLSKDNTHIRANSDWRGFRMEPAIGFDQIRLICCKQN
jgi:hypothetical protein